VLLDILSPFDRYVNYSFTNHSVILSKLIWLVQMDR